MEATFRGWRKTIIPSLSNLDHSVGFRGPKPNLPPGVAGRRATCNVRLLISAGQQSQYRSSARAAANEPPESEDLAASQNAVDNDEARPGDEISESELERDAQALDEALQQKKKGELQNIMRKWGGRTTGTREMLIRQIIEIKLEARRKNISESEVIVEQRSSSGQQSQSVDLNLGSNPRRGQLVELSVPQLKAQLTSLGLATKGNKPELLNRLQSYYFEKNSPAMGTTSGSDDDVGDDGGEETAQAKQEREIAEAAKLRQDREAELQLLTVSEIKGLLRKRRMPVGMGKRKSELIQKLLDDVYPITSEGVPIPASEREDRGGTQNDFVTWRNELKKLLQRHIPAWRPMREDDDFQFWPVLDLKRAAAERDLSLSGTRSELVARLEESQANLFSHVEKLEEEDLKRMLFWFGMEQPPASLRTARLLLTSLIEEYPWYSDAELKYERLENLSHLPWIDTRLNDPEIHVAVVTDLNTDTGCTANIAALKSILQHIHTSIHQEPNFGIYGVSADAFFVMGDRIWRLDPLHLHVQSGEEVMLQIQNHGQEVDSWEEFELLLATANAYVLPVVTDSDRSLLRKLENASIDYIGSAYKIGQDAAHKAKLNDTLKRLNYPVIPQLFFDEPLLESLKQELERDGAMPDANSDEARGTAPKVSEGKSSLEVPSEEREGEARSAQEAEIERLLKEREPHEVLLKLEAWVAENGLDGAEQAFVIKPAQGSLSVDVVTALTIEETIGQLAELSFRGHRELVVEPLVRNMMEFSVTVIDTSAGPRAFMPLEIEIDDPEVDFIDADLQVQKFFATVEGWTDESELAANLRAMKEEQLASQSELIMYDLEKKLAPHPSLKIRSPPRLDTLVTMGIRDVAVKAFRDLRLKDIARIDGYVQLPPKPVQEEERLDELDQFSVPTVDELAPRLRPSDNSGMIPPWDPVVPPPERDEPPEWVGHILDDPNFEDMGPYTNPELASQYHGGGVEIETDGFDESGRPIARIVPKAEADSEEDSDEDAPWASETYDPSRDEMEHLSDKVEWIKPRKDLVGKSWQEKAEIIAPKQENPLDSFTPDFDAVEAAAMCCHKEGTVLITDVNVAPPLDADSLVFKSAAQVGLTPSGVFRQLVSNCLVREDEAPLPWRGVPSIKDTILRKQEFPKPALDWDNYAPVTERERAQPWFHPRFGYEPHPDDLEDPKVAGGASESDDLADSLEGPLARELAGASDEEEQGEREQIRKKPLRPRFSWDPPQEEVSEDRGPGEASTSGEDHLPLHTGYHPEEFFGDRQRVWILCGGAGSGADLSVESGMNVYNILKDQMDLIVELFLVARPCGGRAEKERRQALLFEHVHRVKISSNPDINQPPELLMDNIRNPPLADVEVRNRETWCLPCHLLLSRSAEALQEACEWTVNDNSQPAQFAEPWQRDSEAFRHLVRDQLLQAGVVDAGSGWGHEKEVVAPVCIDMYELIVRANFVDAVVLNLVPGDVGENGQLQELCEQMGTAYVGSGPATSAICSDRLKIVDALAELDLGVVDTPVRHAIDSSQLIQTVELAQPMDPVFERAAAAVGLMAGDSMCLRPINETGELGSARLGTVHDFEVYGGVLRQRLPAIPEGHLSWGNQTIPMPAKPAQTCVVERYIKLDNLRLKTSEEGKRVDIFWETPRHEVEIEIGLLGVEGRMKALTPAIFARLPPSTLHSQSFEEPAPASGEEGEDWVKAEEITIDLQGRGLTDAKDMEEEKEEESEPETQLLEMHRLGDKVPLCPPPVDLLSPEILTAIQEKAEIVATELKLAGLASIRGYVNTDTGSLTVLDVNTVPDLTTGSLIFKQAIAEDPPLEPHELLKRLAHQALIKYDKSGNPIEAAIDPTDLPSPDQLPALSSLPKNPMTRPKADDRSMATN